MNNNNWRVGLSTAFAVATLILGCHSQLRKETQWFHHEPSSVSSEPGLNARPSNQSCLATRFQQPAAIRLEPLVPEGSFRAPVSAASLPGDDTTFYVLEQPGTIWRLETGGEDHTLEKWLSLQETFNVVFLADGCHECGLYSLAFHPDFADNGFIYLSFTEGGDGDMPLVSKIVRVRSPDGGALIGPR